MIMDLHNHTIFSYDGKNTPCEIVENAIEHGVDVIGITDHQFSIGSSLEAYKRSIKRCAAKYSKYIRVLTGLEIGTRPRPDDLLTAELDGIDYVLFESLDDMRAMDFFEFIGWRHRFECPAGLAHCDIFAMGERYGLDMTEVLRTEKLFWELNTSGNYLYYYDFLTNPAKRNAIKRSGIGVSVGSDTHAVFEYRAKQLKSANELVESMGLPLPFRFDQKV